jgi:uncharacterized membrane protein
VDETPEPRRPGRKPFKRGFVLAIVAIAVILLIAAHGLVLHDLLSRTSMSTAVIVGLIVAVVIAHLGWLARNFRRCWH